MVSTMSATAVIATSVTFAVMLIMMIAANIGIEVQISGNKSCNCFVCTTGYTTVQFNTCCC